MSDGIMSGVNCTREWPSGQRLRERADEQRLAQSRHAFDENVPRCDERDQHLLDCRRLADHRVTDGRAQVVERFRCLGGLRRGIHFKLLHS